MKFEPDRSDLQEFLDHLSAETVQDLAQLAERGERNYRQRRRATGNDPSARLEVVCEYAGTIFKHRAVEVLERLGGKGDFEAFQNAICMEGGEAETAFWYAHKLRWNAEGSRMPQEWCFEVAGRLRRLIRDFEDHWHDRKYVPSGWEEYLGKPEEKISASSSKPGEGRGTTASPDEGRDGPLVPVDFEECSSECTVPAEETTTRGEPGGTAESAQITASERNALVQRLEQHIRKGKDGNEGYYRSKEQFCGHLKIDPAEYYRWQRGEQTKAKTYPKRIENAIRRLKP